MAHHGHGATVDRLVDEGGAVGPQAGQREEEIARHHAAAVHREAGDGAVERAPQGDDIAFLKIV